MTMFLSYLWEYYVEVSFYFTLGLVFVAIFQLLLTKRDGSAALEREMELHQGHRVGHSPAAVQLWRYTHS